MLEADNEDNKVTPSLFEYCSKGILICYGAIFLELWSILMWCFIVGLKPVLFNQISVIHWKPLRFNWQILFVVITSPALFFVFFYF